MNTITQSERGLKHITFLRRVILQKLTGSLHIQFITGEKKELLFSKGNFVECPQTVNLVLRSYFSTPVTAFSWESKIPQVKNTGCAAPWIALTNALRDLPMSDKRLALYQSTFKNLPPMLLKSCPIHRLNFADEESYLLLYQLSLGAPNFDLRIFFLGRLNQEDLTKHVRTVLLVLLLGFLRPAPKEESENKNVSIVSRILNRFKATGAA